MSDDRVVVKAPKGVGSRVLEVRGVVRKAKHMRRVVFCAPKGYGATGPARRGRLRIAHLDRATASGAVGNGFKSRYALKTQSLDHRLVVRGQILQPSGNGVA